MKFEPTPTKNTVVKCNGGGGVLGHPVIYLNLGEEGKITCPYCSKYFVKSSSGKRAVKMNKMLKNIVILIFFSGMLNITWGCAEKKKIGLPNPASQYCIEKGGKLEMKKDAKGGVHGICIFPGNLQCEEWAMFRGECPLGGIDVKGLSTPGAITCAVKGGKVLGNETKCQLPSGKICKTDELYQGTCY